MSFLGRIRDSLTRTKNQIVDRFEEIVRKADAPERRQRPVDVETVDALEEVLIGADIGVAASERIVQAVKSRSARTGLRDLVKQEIRATASTLDGKREQSAANALQADGR